MVRGRHAEMLGIAIPVGLFVREGQAQHGAVGTAIEGIRDVLTLRRHTKAAL